MQLQENQTTEFKVSWREDYLKSLCAFANTNGGTLFIGKDDNGNVVGISNHEVLLETIPNQVKDGLGIFADVRYEKIRRKNIVVIKIAPSKNAVSYKGKFYKRSGSTTQLITGVQLNQFLLDKNNLTWESLIEESAAIEDIDTRTIEHFKKLSISRFPTAGADITDLELLQKLHLIKDKHLTRAAILVFGKDPQKFFTESYIKIGRFKNDVNISGMDEIRGNLFQQIGETMDVLTKKYLNSNIKIGKLYRQDKLEIPEASLREAIVNAIVHRDYSVGTTQIRIYPDHVSIWNFGDLNGQLTVEELKKQHPSFPRNSVIAEIFHKAGLIEKWGYGTLKMTDECRKAGLPDPEFVQQHGGLLVTFQKDIFTEEYLKKLQLNDRQIKAMMYVKEFGKITNSEFQALACASKRTATNDLKTLTGKGLLIQQGTTGKGTSYIFKGAIKGQ